MNEGGTTPHDSLANHAKGCLRIFVLRLNECDNLNFFAFRFNPRIYNRVKIFFSALLNLKPVKKHIFKRIFPFSLEGEGQDEGDLKRLLPPLTLPSPPRGEGTGGFCHSLLEVKI